MANWTILKAAIANVIKTNGNQEITGAVLQNTLNSIVNAVGEYATFAGIAIPTTNPGAPDGPVFYLATKPGVYSNFGGLEVGYNEAVILSYNNSAWIKKNTDFATSTQIKAIVGKSSDIEYISKPNYYWNGSRYTEHAYFDSTEQIPVSAGTAVQVTGTGGADGRLVYYYNNSGKLLFISDGSSTSDIVVIFEDGYIICNTNKVDTLRIILLSSTSPFGQIAKNSNKLNARITELEENTADSIGNLKFTSGTIPDIAKNGIHEFLFYVSEETKAKHTNFKLINIGWFENSKRVMAQITATKVEDSTTAYFSGVMLTDVESVNDLPSGINEYNYFIENYGLHIIIDFDYIKEATNKCNGTINPISIEESHFNAIAENTAAIAENAAAIAENTAVIAENTAVIAENTKTDNSALQVGYYYRNGSLSIGSTHPDAPVEFTTGPKTSWGCIKLHVYKGSKIILRVKGGINGRAYALTDNSRKILALADASLDTMSSPITLTVEEDGYLYVNQNGTTDTAFSVTVRQDKITPIVEIVLNQKKTDNSALQVGYYYNNGYLSIGSTHPDAPVKFTSWLETTWGCIKLAVYKGSKIILRVKGGINGRAYALTDNSRKILALADASLDTMSSPITLTVEEDGYLYVNQNDTTNTAFSITVNESIDLQIQSLNARITELEENPAPSVVAPKMYNPILNLQKEQLRILDIGNSYTADATHYLPEVVTASGIDISNICLYTAQRGGASFKNWFDIYHDQDTVSYGVSKCFGGLTANITGTAAIGNGERFRNTLINNEWDLIIIHQVSTYAPYFDKWEEDSNAGYLSKFIRLLRKHQPKAAIGFLLVHSYWSGYGGNTEKSSLERWKLIAESAKKLRANYGIDFIIPYGTAIQNLRASSLNNEYDLTADGTHCANGIADYTAACTYFQSLLSPRYGVSVLGNTARITVEQTETYPSSDISVTDENAPTCQKAAFLATYNWYECINPDDIDDEDLI